MTRYLIAHIEHTLKSSEHITWWNPNSLGYTVCINKAGRYTEDEARSICRLGTCIAVPELFVELRACSTPYYRKPDATLAKMYDGDKHSVVPNTADVWKKLFAECLVCEREHPVKPTPMSARASRVIYLDGVA